MISESIFQYAKWITIVFTVGRLILILISIKHLRICKIYFYYEQVLFLCSLAMPLGMRADDHNYVNMLENQKNFALFYFDLWPCLICSLIGQAITPVFRWINYNEDGFDAKVVYMTLMVMVQLLLGCLIIHMIFTKFGFNYLSAELERRSNELVLNNLEEGVIII